MSILSRLGLGVAILSVSALGAGAEPIENTPDTLIFSVAGGARFDDNRDATENDKEAMTTLNVTPGVRLTVDDLITQAFVSYQPSLLWRDNPRDDQNDTELYHALEASVNHAASYRLTLGALNKFQMTDDPNVSEGGTTVREDASYWFNETKAWLAFGLSERTQWTLDGSYLIKRYEDDDYSDSGDEDRLQLNTSLRYRLEPEYYSFVFAGYDQPTYQNDVRGDYRGYLGGVGLDRAFNDQLKGSVALGYEYLDYESANEDDTTLPYVQVAAEFKPFRRLIIRGAAAYSLQPSDRSLYSSKEDLRLSLKGIVTLSESLSADAQALYDNGYYNAENAIEGDEAALNQQVVDGDDTLMDFQLGLNYRPVGSRYSGRLAYEYEDWDSDVRESFTRNTLSAELAFDF